MKPILFRLLPSVLLAGALGAVAAEESAPTLKAGDAAPALKVSSWVKGDAVEKLASGKIYVVEFWATWCGPCKVSIPHLTELAKKHKDKATVIGVSIWEREKDPAALKEKVTKFVTDMGDKMDYHVAMDTEDKFMADHWMKAAGETGIPCAFIVGKDGKVQWIGHPMMGLDTALEKVIAGTFDLKAAAAEKEQKDSAQKKQQETMRQISTLSREGKHAEALAEFDKMAKENPDFAKRAAMMRLNLVLASDPAAGKAEIKKLAEGEAKDNPRTLMTLARLAGSPQNKQPDHEFAVSLAEKAMAQVKEPDAMMTLSYAEVLHAKGDTEKAIAKMEEAIKLVETDKNMPPTFAKALKDRLEKMKAGTAK